MRKHQSQTRSGCASSRGDCAYHHQAGSSSAAGEVGRRSQSLILVEKMIADAERQYQQGQSDYQAGHLEAAKADFDQAVSVLMQGPVDIHSDERLQREFDRS